MRPAALAALLCACALCRAEETPPRFLGARGCRDCHSTASIGDQYGAWKKSAHARAFETLQGEEAKKVAGPLGVSSPSTDARCTKCHVTAWDQPAERKAWSFRTQDGVSCESCHGPGEQYSPRDVMTNRSEAVNKGLLLPTKDTCVRCHNAESPTFRGFDFEKASAAMSHPLNEDFAWDTSIAWLTDYDKALAAARTAGKPLLVDFHPGIGCPRCTEMRDAYQSPEVVSAASQCVCVRIEAPTKAQLAQFGLSDCATRVVMPDGKVEKDLYGAVGSKVLAHVLLRVTQYREGFALDANDPKAKDIEEVWGLLTSRGGAMLEYVAKRFVELGRVCEPLLLKEVWNPSSPYRGECLRMIGRVEAAENKAGRPCNPTPGVDPFWDLLAFAFDPSPDLRRAAVEALGYVGDRRAGAPLARYLTNDSDARVATAAFTAVVASRDPESVPWLISRALEPHCAEPRCPVPLDALVALGAIGDASAEEPLLRALPNRPELAPAILCALADMKAPNAPHAALAVLADRNQSFFARNEAVFTVSRSGSAKAWRELLPFLSDPNVEIRGGICEATGDLAVADGIDPMMRACREDPSEVPRAYAAWAMGRCVANAPQRKDEVVALLEGLLSDRSALVRVQALRALVGMGREELAFLLRDALHDNATWNTEDRKALTLAAETLADRKDAEAVAPLVALLDDRDLDTSRVAAACLERITGEAQGHAGQVPLHLQRSIFAMPSAETILIERKRIIDTVVMIIPKWQRWLKERPAPPPAKDGDMEASLVTRSIGNGPAKEVHRWLRLRAGAEDLRMTATEQGAVEPHIDRIVLSAKCPECAHAEGWEATALPSPHRCDGALWIRWSAGFEVGEHAPAAIRVRAATAEWTAEKEAGR